MIVYQDSVDEISPDQLPGFFVGWPNPPSPETHLKILRESQAIVLALDEEQDQVVGFITAVSDGVLCAYIPLLEVLPDYQGRGIGKELTRRMLEKLHGLYMIDLLCDEKVQGFYSNLGMQPATGMTIRNFARQSGIE